MFPILADLLISKQALTKFYNAMRPSFYADKRLIMVIMFIALYALTFCNIHVVTKCSVGVVH
jgi:hypothetical protein